MFKKGVDIWSQTSIATIQRQLPLMIEADVEFIRTNTSGSTLIREVKNAGIDVIGLIWTRSVLTSPTTYDKAAWRAYVTAQVNTLKDVCKTYEIWNEPDQPAYGYASVNLIPPTQYVAMLQDAYEVAKAADPSCLILGGSVSNAGENYGLAYFRQLLDLNFTEYCDAVSYHPYCVTVSPLYPNVTSSGKAFWKLQQVRDDMIARGIDKQIWITESGWSSAIVSETDQATYIQQAMALAASWGWCECYTYYSWQDGGDGPFGLINSAEQRKPSFYAFKNFDPENPEPPQCPTGFHWDWSANACVQDVPQCPIGFHWDPVLKECISDVLIWTLIIVSTTGGTTDPIPAQYVIEQGKTVSVFVIPQTDYMFDHWELDGVDVGSASPYTVTMDKDKILLAVFVVKPPPPPTKKHLTISSTVGGTTTPESGTWEFDEGAQVIVRANPDNEYSFDHWELDGIVQKDNPIIVTMDVDHALHVVFIVKSIPPVPIPLWKIGAAILAGVGGVTAGIVIIK